MNIFSILLVMNLPNIQLFSMLKFDIGQMLSDLVGNFNTLCANCEETWMTFWLTPAEALWKLTINDGAFTGVLKEFLYLHSSNSMYTQFLDLGKAMYDIVAEFGIGLALVYWTAGIIDKLSKDKLSIDTLMRSFIELIVAFAIIVNGFQIFTSASGLGIWATEKVLTTTHIEAKSNNTVPYDLLAPGIFCNKIHGAIAAIPDGQPVTKENIVAARRRQIENGGALGFFDGLISLFTSFFISGFEGLITMIIAFIVFAATKLMYLWAVTIAISRAIQIVIYTCFAPIGISQWFNRGGMLDSAAMGYIKKYIALVFQAPVLVLILKLNSALVTSYSNGGFTTYGLGIGLLVAIQFITISLINKSQQFANDIIGT